MLSFVEIVFSAIGVYGFFSNNLLCIIVGLIAIIICDIIDIFILKHNPTTVMIASLVAIGASIGSKDPLRMFCIFLCGENLIMSVVTLAFLGISYIIAKVNTDKDDESEIVENDVKEFPMKWWKVWQYFLFPFGIIISGLSISQYTSIDFGKLDLYGWIFTLGDIAVFILLCCTYIDFIARKKRGYNLLILYIIMSTVWRILIVTLVNVNNQLSVMNKVTTNDLFFDTYVTFLITLVIMCCIWIYPNYRYFKKRKNLFYN